MMAEVDVLVEGYTSDDGKGDDGNEATCCTITLVRDNGIVMVVDPGTLKSQDILVNALKERDLSTDDVNVVFLTHSHIDHFRNIGMFPNAKVIEYYGEWKDDLVDDRRNDLTDDLKIIETPGHNVTSLSLVVNTDKGKVVICGDVFWKKDFPEKDPYADDVEKLKESRKKILEIADYIIPGHAGMYGVKR